MSDGKVFPVQGPGVPSPIRRSDWIPWEVAEVAYERYAHHFGDRQTLERLGERGGFGVEELAGLLVDAVPGLLERIHELESATTARNQQDAQRAVVGTMRIGGHPEWAFELIQGDPDEAGLTSWHAGDYPVYAHPSDWEPPF